ncbi:MAG: phenylacetate--CoA ligase family protein [Promethearchaeota archaeon]
MTKKYLYWDEKAEKMPWDELNKLHIRKGNWTLNRILEHSRNKNLVKRYKDAGITSHMIKSLDDFQKIPFMTKQDFLDSYPYGMLCSPVEDLVRMHCTSGTSGHRPTCGFYTENDLENWSILCAKNLTAIGVTKKDVFQNTTSSGLFTGGYGYTQGATKVGAMVIPFGGGMTKKQIQFFKDFKVTAIHAIPSFGLRIAEVCEQEGVDPEKDLYLEKGILGAEGWAESTRKRIESALHMKVYDNYGLTEASGPGVAVECLEQDKLHIWSDFFYPEIIDPDTGEVLGEGETGELVLTSLFKEAVPILRYRTGDITALYKSECECGRTGYMIDRIKGRKDDMHVIKGVNIYPSQIEEEIFKIDAFTDTYLILFHTVGVMDQVSVIVETKPGADVDKALKELDKALYEATMMKIRVEAVPEGTLPRSEGKAVRWKDIRDRPDGFKGWKREYLK